MFRRTIRQLCMVRRLIRTIPIIIRAGTREWDWRLALALHGVPIGAITGAIAIGGTATST